MTYINYSLVLTLNYKLNSKVNNLLYYLNIPVLSFNSLKSNLSLIKYVESDYVIFFNRSFF